MAGEHCGVLTQTGQGDLKFQYAPGYRSTPLSLSMPVSDATYSKSKILPFLQGLLPDNPEALAASARRFSVSERNPFALLEHIGGDVSGALEFLPAGATFSGAPGDSGEPDAAHELDEALLAEQLAQQVDEYLTGNPGVHRGQFSLAGAQPKLALHQSLDGRWFASSRAMPSTHILKPLSSRLENLDVAELLTMRVAARLGLAVAETDFLQVLDQRVLVTKRYDRHWVDGSVHRLHQEDLCQALGVPPSKKYQRFDGGPGVGAVAQLLRLLPLADRAQVAHGFFEGLVFNTLVRATDAHAKNYSLLLSGDSVRLAPLYDLISGAVLPAATHAAMSIGGEFRFDSITETALVAEGERMLVEDPKALVESMRDRLPAAVAEVSGELEAQLPAALGATVGNLAGRMLGFMAGRS